VAISIQQVNTAASADTYGSMFSKLNQVINAISTQVVTIAANSSGGVTTGNAHIGGYFSATLIAANTLRGGNVATAAALIISSNVNVTGSVFSIGNTTVNTSINSTAIAVNNAVIQNLTAINFSLSALQTGNSLTSYVTYTTTGTSAQNVDSFATSTYRMAKYVAYVADNNANAFFATELVVLFDGSNGNLMEYGQVLSNTTLGVFTATQNSTHAILNFTPTSTNTTIKAVRTAIGI
jgi:hypothetical protein